MKTILFMILSFIYIGNIYAQEEKIIVPVTDVKTGYILNTKTGNFVDYVRMYLGKTIDIYTGEESAVLVAMASNGEWDDYPINKCNLSSALEIRAYYISEKENLALCGLFGPEHFKKGHIRIYNTLVQELINENSFGM